MTTGEAGMRAQALGLADAINLPYEEKIIRIKAPWRWLPVGSAPGALSDLAWHGDRPTPPWPRVLISCGRRSAIISAEIKRQAGDKTRTICIGDPRTATHLFDMIIAQPHDRVRGPNVLLTETSLHRFTPARLASAREKGALLFKEYSRPLLGVLVGGPVKGRGFTEEDGSRLAATVRKRLDAYGGSALIATSRRTRPEVAICLQQIFRQKSDVYFWNEEGENPYEAILASSDRLIVSSDSVTMTSEALASGAPVELFEVSGIGRRQKLFAERISALGLASGIDMVNYPQSAPIAANLPYKAISPVDAAAYAAQEFQRQFKGKL